jgi:hypothetical protein
VDTKELMLEVAAMSRRISEIVCAFEDETGMCVDDFSPSLTRDGYGRTRTIHVKVHVSVPPVWGKEEQE